MTALSLLMVLVALVAAINPPTLFVMIASITSLFGKGKHPKHAGLHSALFALGVGASLFIVAWLWYLFLGVIPTNYIGYIGLFLSLVVVIFGLLEIKDYFWYGKGLSFKLSDKSEKKIHAWTKKHHSHLRGFMLGVYTTFKLSHYTLVLLLASVVLGKLVEPANLSLIVTWVVSYISPMLLIAILVSIGMNAHSLTQWHEQSKHSMRLSIGLVYVLVGWLILTVMAGGIKLV